jgi:L-galactose dehydrogenase
MMRTRKLGRTSLQVTEISLGGLFFGDPAQEAGSRAVVDRALELGVNWIDTAAGYKESEAVLGRILKGRRDRVCLSTKHFPYSNWPDELDLRPASLEAAVERSLTRLQTDVIDLFQLHWISPVEDLQAILDSEFPATFERLREQGKIRYVGLSNASEYDGTQQVLIEAVRSGVFDTVMCCYNVFFQTAERELLDLCRENDVGVLVMMPLDQPSDGYGLASRDSVAKSVRAMISHGLVPDEPPYDGEGPLDFLLEPPVTGIPGAALRFCLSHPAVSTVLSGTSNVAHLEANVAAADGQGLPPAHLERLREMFGHLEEHKVRPESEAGGR